MANPLSADFVNRKPFFQRPVVSTRDPGEARAVIGQRLKDHRLDFAGANRNIDSCMNELRLGSISLFYLRYGADVLIDPGSFGTFYIVHINIGGSCDILFDDHERRVCGPAAAICSPDYPARFQWRPDSEVLGIKIPREALEIHYQELTGLPLRQSILFDEELNLESETGQRFIALLRYIAMDSCLPNGMWTTMAGSLQIETMVLSTLLLSQAGSHHSLANPPVSPASPYYVRRAEAYMQENLQRPLRLSEIAAHAGVSDRSLITGFQRFRGVSPMAYFTNMRLEGARRDLAKAMPGETVASVAHRWGFTHLGSFASRYRRRFGALPVETLTGIEH